MRALLGIGLMLCALGGPALADALEDGYRAAEREDYAAARELWTPLAEAGNAEAQANLAVLYDHGLGVEANPEEAVRLYLMAIAQGEIHAMTNYASMNRAGRGIPRDDARAAEYFRLAAEQGYPRAQNALGGLYRDGEGVERDLEEAARWIEAAAAQDYPAAQATLALMYANGEGVERNMVLAHMWATLGSNNGNDIARDARASFVRRMTRRELAESFRLVREWRPTR